MGDLMRLAVPVVLEKTKEFSNYSGTVYMFWLRSRDNKKEIPFIVVDTATLTLSDFNQYDDGTDVPLGAILINLNDGKWYIRYNNGTTTAWTIIGNVT
ncbi:MAG: hypothetical protein GXO75_08260 [Calditrichaeota bacterium]|nr:hypothetical protein [Calditrichota bacterium]